jgi:hypothetical protein
MPVAPLTPTADTRKHFDLDLKFGQDGEQWLKMLGVSAAQMEVKRDSHTVRTGNLFFETQCSGKDSGINVTTADWWCSIADVDRKPVAVFIFATELLRQNLSRLIALGRIHKKHGIGDGGRVSGLLVPLTMTEELIQP